MGIDLRFKDLFFFHLGMMIACNFELNTCCIAIDVNK